MKINKIIAVPVALAIALGSLGVAGAQVASPRVALQFATNGLTSPLSASSTDATIARLVLDTTGSTEPVRIAAVPFRLTLGGGASASTLMNCRVFNEAAPSIALNSNTNTNTSPSSGLNNIMLTNSLVVSANTITTLALRCDVGGDLVAGGTFTVNMNTSDLAATGALTGIPALVTIRGSAVVPPVVPPVTPGIPATGSGGEVAQSVAMLLASLLLAGLGFSYLKLKRS